ncbi:MAG: DMT family transporter [Sarcina sp.]
MKKTMGIIFAILSSASFGLLGIFAEFAYRNGSDPTTVLIARFSIAAVVLLILLLVTKKSLKITKKQLIILFLIGVFGYTLTTQTLFQAYNYISVGLATAISFVYPLFVCILAFIFNKEKFTKKKTIGLVISIIGVFLLSSTDLKVSGIEGIFLSLASGLVYGAILFVMGKDEIRKIDGLVISFYCCLFAAITALGMGLFEHNIVLKMNLNIGLSYIGIAIISTVLSLVFLQLAIQDIGSSKAAILGTFEPIVGVLASCAFLGEKLSIVVIIGVVIIIIAAMLAIKDEKISIHNEL